MKLNPTINKPGCVVFAQSPRNARGGFAAPLGQRMSLVKGGERHA